MRIGNGADLARLNPIPASEGENPIIGFKNLVDGGRAAMGGPCRTQCRRCIFNAVMESDSRIRMKRDNSTQFRCMTGRGACATSARRGRRWLVTRPERRWTLACRLTFLPSVVYVCFSYYGSLRLFPGCRR